MPHFMLKLKFAQASVQALIANPSDRRKAAVDALGAVGATLKDYYFAFGDADALVIYEAPDNSAAAALAMTLGASGSTSSVETVPLMTMEEAMAAMKKAGATHKAYKPPSAAKRGK
jgi:uncharacterized protein with GYD domain